MDLVNHFEKMDLTKKKAKKQELIEKKDFKQEKEENNKIKKVEVILS